MNKDTFLYKDCLLWLKELQDNSIDLVVTDPPYGINYNNNRRNKNWRITTENWISNDKDNIKFLSKVLKEVFRVLKDWHHLYWFWRYDKLPEQIIEMQKIWFVIKNQLIWVKNNHWTGDLFSSYAGKYESIVYAVKKQKKTTKIFHLQEVDWTKRHTDVLYYDKVASKKMIHDHQKPQELLEFLIKKSSIEWNIVLDPFCWSASTLIAAYNQKRNFIWYEFDEKNPEIYKSWLKRLLEKINQDKLNHTNL